MLWIIVFLLLVAIVIILLLPEKIVSKISSVAVAIGILFTAYTLWHDTENERKAAKQREIDMNSEYWNKIYSLFVTKPELSNMHSQIFGSMFSIMMQTVESVAESDVLESSWIHTIKRWVSHPSFILFWKENEYDYTEYTRNLISSILRQGSY